MNFRKFLVGALCFLALGTSFTACSDDDEVMNDNGSKIELPSRRAYILYEGAFSAGTAVNNTGIAFYAPNKDADFNANIYKFQNNKDLGNLGQSMIKYNDFIYVVVSASKSVVKLNEAGVEVARCDFKKEEGKETDARYIVAEDGFLYVTQYGGTVSKIDANSMKEVSTFKGGNYLEGIAECGGNFYVANSRGTSKEILVFNEAKAQPESIEVVTNPSAVLEEDDMIYVISNGNYADIRNQFQVIDPKTKKSEVIAEATRMAEGNGDLIYLVDTKSDWAAGTTENKLFSYNTKTHQINNQSFLTNAPKEITNGNIYMIAVDDDTDEIYVGVTDYATPGTIYRFDSNGNLKDTFSAGGVNPNTMIFVD